MTCYSRLMVVASIEIFYKIVFTRLGVEYWVLKYLMKQLNFITKNRIYDEIPCHCSEYNDFYPGHEGPNDLSRRHFRGDIILT
jgi:hypothetical protein